MAMKEPLNLLIDPSEVFDTVDHLTLTQRVFIIGIFAQAVGWFMTQHSQSDRS